LWIARKHAVNLHIKLIRVIPVVIRVIPVVIRVNNAAGSLI
jgi:hypothetical protein